MKKGGVSREWAENEEKNKRKERREEKRRREKKRTNKNIPCINYSVVVRVKIEKKKSL